MDLNYRIENDTFDIILYIKYILKNELSKIIKFTYSKKELYNLFVNQGKENFMQYQFKYIADELKDLDLKESFINQRQNIRKDILKLLNVK